MIKKIPLHIKILTGMLLGLAWGILSVNMGKEWTGFSQDYIHPFGTIFMNLLKLIAIPMILTSLITGIASLNDIGKLGRIGGKTLGIFVGTTIIAISIGLIMVNVVQPGKQMSETTRDMLMKSNEKQMLEKTIAAESVKSRPALQPLVDLFPDNVIHAAGDNGNMLQIVIFAVFLGIAI
ncbi:MAG: dicarboxylate/amino acid:cation symporter, partial [Bacteroidia bacterium]